MGNMCSKDNETLPKHKDFKPKVEYIRIAQDNLFTIYEQSPSLEQSRTQSRLYG